MKCNLFGTTTFDSPAAGAAYNATLDHLDDHLDVSMYCAYESNEMLHWRIVRSINMGEFNWFNNQTATDPTTKQILQGNLVAKYLSVGFHVPVFKQMILRLPWFRGLSGRRQSLLSFCQTRRPVTTNTKEQTPQIPNSKYQIRAKPIYRI